MTFARLLVAVLLVLFAQRGVSMTVRDPQEIVLVSSFPFPGAAPCTLSSIKWLIAMRRQALLMRCA